MFPKSTFLELKGKEIEIFVKDLPNPHSLQIGIIINVTEHLVVLQDTEWKDRRMTIPIENIVMIKEILQ